MASEIRIVVLHDRIKVYALVGVDWRFKEFPPERHLADIVAAMGETEADKATQTLDDPMNWPMHSPHA